MTFHTRRLTPQPTTLDPAARTIEAIVSTFADVQRGSVTERLDPAGCDLSRFIGAPVLDAHRSSSTRDQLGVIDAAEVRPEGLWVRIRFRGNDAAQAVLADVADGTLRGLSIGYQVAEWSDTRDGDRRIRTAKRWAPIEASVVPVPADPGAHFRHGASQMEPEVQTAERPAEEPARITRAAANAAIRSIAQTAGLPHTWADAQIDAEAIPEAARAEAFEAMRQRQAATPIRATRAEVGFSHDAPEAFVQRHGEALYARNHPGHALSPEARQFAGLTLLDVARQCCERAGISTRGRSPDAVFDAVLTRAGVGYQSTSDFPAILANVGERELGRTYAAAEAPIRRLARGSTARDFRPRTVVSLGGMPQLLEVNEAGEFQYGAMAGGAETIQLRTVGRITAVTRQALINDDLGALSGIPAAFGAEAANYEAAQLVRVLEANPALADGKAVFHADHGNLAGVGDLGSDRLAAARLAMGRMTGPAGQILGLAPRFLLVPPELQIEAERAVAEVAAATVADANPFSTLTLVVEPRLTNATQWYLVADPAAVDGLHYLHLEGAQGPQIDTRAGFEVDGVEIKCRLDFGAGWLDWRGWQRSG